ncbi:MAG TPA: NAD-dependent epimerase/dehydratase family protein [Candidatus Acidoferrum sp.]|nr:NAD-dependent epimerase/dehydratase family protein [Candidatus Acidoferrum sp.]
MKVLLFGASGTAGGAVLQACLDTPVVEEVRVIVRRPLGRTDAKLREFVHANYLDYAAVREAFRGVDACFFCLGISVTQVSKEEFVKISHDYPVAAARMLKAESPDAAFHYISGAGTRADSRTFWSKVKGQTENELMELAGADCWRPAFIDAKPSASLPKVYAMLRPALRLLKPFRSMYVAGEDLGRAMLEATRENLRRRVIENAEIRELAGRFSGRV